MRFTSLNAWLQWQETLHPEEIELGLERVARVWQAMQSAAPSPGFNCPVISVAGTNGKGSSIAILEAIYLAAGYRVGCYTSPHLYRYNERIRLNGEAVADEAIIDTFQLIDEARTSFESDISLTYFEFGTLAALQIFADAELDIVLLEVGLGGRLDAVNIIDADVALITSIDLDHQAWLGNTREDIAREKAGILRAKKTCVLSDPDIPSLIEEQAKALGCMCYVAGDAFEYQLEQGQWRWQANEKIRAALPLPALNGQHQLQNAAAVLMVVEILQQRLAMTQQSIRNGLLSASLPGRFEIRPGDVTTILDVAHNPAAAVALAESLKAYAGSRRVLCVFSILADKDVANVLKPLVPLVSHWSLAPISTDRGMPIGEIEQELSTQLHAQKVNIMQPVQVESHATIQQASAAVKVHAKPGDIILVYGSFYIVAEVGAEAV